MLDNVRNAINRSRLQSTGASMMIGHGVEISTPAGSGRCDASASRRLHRWVCLVVSGCLLVAGCATNSTQPGRRPPEPLPSNKTSNSVDAPAALAASVGMWRTWTLAARTSDATDPDLVLYAMAAALSKLAVVLGYHHDRGWVLRGEPVLHPEVTAVSAVGRTRTATVEDCVDTSGWRAHSTTGTPVDDGFGG